MPSKAFNNFGADLLRDSNRKSAVKNKALKVIINEWKQVLGRSKKLITFKGTIVTTRDLDFPNASLLKAVRNVLGRKVLISYFHRFKIATDLLIKKYHHDKHMIMTTSKFINYHGPICLDLKKK